MCSISDGFTLHCIPFHATLRVLEYLSSTTAPSGDAKIRTDLGMSPLGTIALRPFSELQSEGAGNLSSLTFPKVLVCLSGLTLVNLWLTYGGAIKIS